MVRKKNILLAFATRNEIIPAYIDDTKSLYPITLNGVDVDVLISGIGSIPTLFNLQRVAKQYDFIINAGIAGSFSKRFKLGSVVLVAQDSFADYGIDSDGEFIHIDETPFSDGSHQLSFLKCPYVNHFSNMLQPVIGITLSTVTGSKDRIKFLNEYWHADIETMESAAVFYLCRNFNIPFIGLRAISNYVEPRNRAEWKIQLALENLWDVLPAIVSIVNSNDFKRDET